MLVYKFTDDGYHRWIRYRGVFDLHGLYSFMAGWIKSKDFDYYERRVLDKDPYKIYKFEGRKKINFAVMFTMNPEIWVEADRQVEVVEDGKVKHMTEGRLRILINGGIIWDYDGDFEKSDGLKKMEKFLFKKIQYHENFLKYIDYMDYFLFDYMTEIKKFLKMETATSAF